MIGKNLVEIFPINMRPMITQIVMAEKDALQEIRLRINQPLLIQVSGREYGLGEKGISTITQAYRVQEADLKAIIKLMSGFSLYAMDEDWKQGFMTLEGGHRIGMVGQMVIESGLVKTIKHVSAMNVRLAHEVIGCSKKVVPHLMARKGVYHTLIVSPPKCGKTTLLRDIIRSLSNGLYGYEPYTVGVVDERSEIAGCYRGIPQNDVGMRTDVLDRCPKVEGMRMLLRAMAPDVIAVDEIGNRKDLEAVEEVLSAGIAILCTTHGKDLNDCLKKPILSKMIQENWFDKVIILSDREGPCTIENIIDLRKVKVGAI